MSENITHWTIPSHCQQIRLCYKENTNTPLYIFISNIMFEHYKSSFKIKKFCQTKQLSLPFASLDTINT
jgi:hypothetical protein